MNCAPEAGDWGADNNTEGRSVGKKIYRVKSTHLVKITSVEGDTYIRVTKRVDRAGQVSIRVDAPPDVEIDLIDTRKGRA